MTATALSTSRPQSTPPGLYRVVGGRNVRADHVPVECGDAAAMSQIAAELNLSQRHVSRLITAALIRLRTVLADR
jgi:hypothetical protein